MNAAKPQHYPPMHSVILSRDNVNKIISKKLFRLFIM